MGPIDCVGLRAARWRVSLKPSGATHKYVCSASLQPSICAGNGGASISLLEKDLFQAFSNYLWTKSACLICGHRGTVMSEVLGPPPGGRQTKGTTFLAIALTLTIIASIVVTVRVYIRIWVKRTFGWDDGLIIISLVRDRLRGSLLSPGLTY